MQWYLLIGVILLCGIVGVSVWSYAYRLGLRHGQATSVPFRVIDELLDHKIHCLGQDPACARMEMETSLHLESWESQSLTQRVLRAPRSQKEEATLAAPTRSAAVRSVS